MRTQFTNELVALTADLTQMCRSTHEAAVRLTDALVGADLAATYEVFALDERVQAVHGSCEARTVGLLALQAPVARDLRHVVTAIQIAGELARIGGLFSRVADEVYRSHPEPVAAAPVLDPLGGLAELAAAATARTEQAVTTGHYSAAGTDTAADAQALDRTLHTALTEAGYSTETTLALALAGHRLMTSLEHTERIERLINFLDTGVPPTAQIVPEEEAAS